VIVAFVASGVFTAMLFVVLIVTPELIVTLELSPIIFKDVQFVEIVVVPDTLPQLAPIPS
jgi:hypothetical protein